ncbi:hypothetical protein P170DRAFT_434570 [Aspergillus steynii IBT 23096]|uniref:Uncharacterized protein n=1 Tax=Aspergillus steynii IBT 23096 TaxID=1392250 RepID=A0A2I2GIY9_9EURO|nr:uncharacterized protein P170DRAFT_434570 [Aspergillus steynii IBT 23096]PLB52846.1 hypothetical protein P170DRAFT_434570 [Aspergillus steynii IBT 23096]
MRAQESCGSQTDKWSTTARNQIVSGCWLTVFGICVDVFMRLWREEANNGQRKWMAALSGDKELKTRAVEGVQPRGPDHSSKLWHVIAEMDLGDGEGKHDTGRVKIILILRTAGMSPSN